MLVLAHEHLFKEMYSDETQFWLAAFSGFLIWQKILYFCKLSDSLGFYVRLIADTFSDMIPFTILLYLVINVFTTSLYILNLERLEVEGSEDGIYQQVIELEEDSEYANYWSGLVFTYNIGLGEFDFDGFEGTYNRTLYLIWFLGTFVI